MVRPRFNPTVFPSPPLAAVVVLLMFSQLFDVVVGLGGFEPRISLPVYSNSNSNYRMRPRGSFRSWRNISVHHFGAKGDGRTDDTQAFVRAWKLACSSRSVAILEIPPDSVYLIRPINFTGPCKSKLTLLIMGTIIAPSDPAAWDGLDTHKWLYFQGVRDLVVTGEGTIDGMGQEWWARSCKRNVTNPCQHAPTALTFHRAKRLTVQDLTLINSQQMHLTFTMSSQVKASRLKVIAPGTSPNTDGIHISSSDSVVVEDSMIRTGDDCISVVGNTSNVLIRNIICGPGHGISIGSLGKSNSTDRVQNVQVDGAFISDTENGVRIKSWQGGSGHARNIGFKNIMMNNVSNPIIINQYYCDSKTPCHNQTSAVKVDNIAFVRIKGTSATQEAIKLACSDTYPCKNIFMEDIELYLESGYEPEAYCWKAFGFSSGVVYPPSCLPCADPPSDRMISPSQHYVQ